MSEWQEWIGREERRGDRVDAAHLGRWLATLDRSAPADGSVPQAFHWCLCTPDAPTSSLGVDGHPWRSLNSFMPPVPLPRRMWASSKLEFLEPIRLGDRVVRKSRVVSIEEKQGSSGRLIFVNVSHETCTDRRPAVRELQSIVYREPATGGIPGLRSSGPDFDPRLWDAHRVLVPTEALLFRFSALTFNTHRIHYDAPYATREEGYRGLVVQGPLIATLLLDLAQRQFGDNFLKACSFRVQAPAFCGEELRLGLRGRSDKIELAAISAHGQTIMIADASL